MFLDKGHRIPRKLLAILYQAMHYIQYMYALASQEAFYWKLG